MYRSCGRNLCVFLCLAAMAGAAPVVDTYKSPDLGNDILNGRWSESFAGGAEGQVGNIIHSASWDGATLATEWLLAGPTLSSVSLIYDGLDMLGNGQQIYQTEYAGGVLTMTDEGPWWQAGDPGTEYFVDVNHYEQTTTMTFVGGERTDLRSTVYLRGDFQSYAGYEVEFIVATAVQLGEGSALPADYPDYIDDDEGHWGVVQKIHMNVIPEPATMSLLGLGALALRKRRRIRPQL